MQSSAKHKLASHLTQSQVQLKMEKICSQKKKKNNVKTCFKTSTHYLLYIIEFEQDNEKIKISFRL